MDSFDWVEIVCAVLVGNGLTAWFAWSLVTITKLERSGGSAKDAPWVALIGAATPGLVIAAGGYLLRA